MINNYDKKSYNKCTRSEIAVFFLKSEAFISNSSGISRGNSVASLQKKKRIKH